MTTPTPRDAPLTEPGTLAKWYAVAVLTIVYIFNFVDRQIISVLQEPMRAELGLSDTQLGLLQGLTFALFYVSMGIPLARWADLGVRRDVVALSVGVWSIMTALCGGSGIIIIAIMTRCPMPPETWFG